MMEDELIKIWQSSSNQERVKFEKSKLMIELQSSLGRLHRWWKYLELLEIISVVIGIIAFAFIFYWVPFTTVKIASILIIVLGIVTLTKILGVNKTKPSDLQENYLKYLKKIKVHLEAQKKLLETYFYWGILPLFPIMLLFLFDFWEIPEKRTIIVITYLITIVMGIYGYFLNKQRVKNEIDPRITKVDALIKELKE
jgi:putative Mn2+ efflux pump MntP